METVRVWLGFAAAVVLSNAAWAADAGGEAVGVPSTHTRVDAVARGPSVDMRLEEIRRRIQRNLVYPPIARSQDVTGSAVVEFAVGTHGRAQDVRLVRSSGAAILDAAATRAVATAEGLPWLYGRLSVPIRFQLNGEGTETVAPR